MSNDETTRDLDPDEMPTRTPADADQVFSQLVDTGEKVMDPEEHGDLLADRLRNPVDFTVDSDAERERDAANRDRVLGYDPIIHANQKAPNVQQDAATWDDLRALSAPPPVPTGQHKVYVCIQHPSLIVFAPDGETVLGRFENGYLATDDARLQKVLEHPSQRYVKRLDMKVG